MQSEGNVPIMHQEKAQLEDWKAIWKQNPLIELQTKKSS